MALMASQDRFKDFTDEQLLERYQEGRELNILGLLYARYMALVYGVCLKYLEDREEANDAVMSIFEKLITELVKHKVEKFKPWLYVLTKNWCLMYLRSARSEKKQMENVWREESLIMESSIDLHPIDKEKGISDASLQDCIKRLKEEQRRCIELFYFENRSYREVADILKLDERRIKSYIQNAKRNLKICLEESYVTEE